MSRKKYDKIIFDLVNERLKLLNIDDNGEITKILLKSPPEIVYKNLVYMNTKSNIGIFALTYLKILIFNIKNNISLFELISECKTPEFDDNAYLTEDEYKCIQKQIKEEMCVINFYVDNLIHNVKKDINTCYQCVCNNMFVNNDNQRVWIVDGYIGYNFYIVELIELIFNNMDNPATMKKFSVHLKEFIRSKYSLYFKIFQTYYDNI